LLAPEAAGLAAPAALDAVLVVAAPLALADVAAAPEAPGAVLAAVEAAALAETAGLVETRTLLTALADAAVELGAAAGEPPHDTSMPPSSSAELEDIRPRSRIGVRLSYLLLKLG
jgi:flagellar biosynthesis/type III secretory pathway ATPase